MKTPTDLLRNRAVHFVDKLFSQGAPRKDAGIVLASAKFFNAEILGDLREVFQILVDEISKAESKKIWDVMIR
jgi:hypothetical protein